MPPDIGKKKNVVSLAARKIVGDLQNRHRVDDLGRTLFDGAKITVTKVRKLSPADAQRAEQDLVRSRFSMRHPRKTGRQMLELGYRGPVAFSEKVRGVSLVHRDLQFEIDGPAFDRKVHGVAQFAGPKLLGVTLDKADLPTVDIGRAKISGNRWAEFFARMGRGDPVHVAVIGGGGPRRSAARPGQASTPVSPKSAPNKTLASGNRQHGTDHGPSGVIWHGTTPIGYARKASVWGNESPLKSILVRGR